MGTGWDRHGWEGTVPLSFLRGAVALWPHMEETVVASLVSPASGETGLSKTISLEGARAAEKAFE